MKYPLKNSYLCARNLAFFSTHFMKFNLSVFSAFLVLVISFSSCKDITNTALNLMSSSDTASVVFPAPLGSVSDYEKILSNQEIRALDSIIMQHERKTDNKISIITVKSIKPYGSLNEYCEQLFNSWENGDNKVKSVLIGLSENSNDVQIIVGGGLKKRLTEKDSKRIIKKSIQPNLEEGDFYKGLEKGLQKIIAEI